VVILAFVVSRIGRQVGNVSEGVRLLNQEGLLWVAALSVSQQAVNERLGSLPADSGLHRIFPTPIRRQPRPLAFLSK
jgi:hypothetical protein